MKNKQLLSLILKKSVFFILTFNLIFGISSNAQPLKRKHYFRNSKYENFVSQQNNLSKSVEDFQVNENVGHCSHWNRDIAVDNEGNFVIVWEDEPIKWKDDRHAKKQIFAQRYDQNGQPLETSFLVAEDGYDSAIGMDGTGNFVIIWQTIGGQYAWTSASHVWAQRYDSNGTALGENIRINDDALDHYPFASEKWNLAIAVNKSNGNFVITWYDKRNNNWHGHDIYAHRCNSDGDTLGANFMVNDDTSTTIRNSIPDVAIDNNGNFVITWEDNRNGNADIYAQRYNSEGKTIDANFKVDDDNGTSEQRNPVIEINEKNNFVIAWQDNRNGNRDIYAQYYDSKGQPIGNNFKVNDDLGNNQDSSVIAMDGNGNFIIAWSDQRNGNSDIYAQFFDSSGNAVGDNFKVNDDIGASCQKSPAIAANEQGVFIISWNDDRNGVWDIYTQLFDSTGQKIGENLKTTEEDGTSWQNTPAITANEAGNFVITWRDFRYDHEGDIYAQRYEINGQAIENNFKINDDIEFNRQQNPALIMNSRGNFIIVWQDKRNGNDDIYGQRFDNSGNPQDSNFRINDDLGTIGQYDPAIGVDGNGNFVVTWEDGRNGNYDILCQRYNSDGAKLGSNFMVNEYAENSGQYEPAISMDNKGNFVVVWQDQRNGNLDIFGQRFDNRGTPQGTNFQINDDEETSDQKLPDISMDSNGNFIVVWRDKRTGKYDIYGQCYTKLGEKRGDNFKINDYTDDRDFLFYPAISANDDSYFVVVWDDLRSGNRDIYYQLFDNEGNKIAKNYRVNDDPSGRGQEKPDVVMSNRYIYYTWTDNRVLGQGYDIFARIDIFNYAPASPILISPPNNSVLSDNIQNLTFTIPDDAEKDSLHFKVEVAQDSSFTIQIAGSPFESFKDNTGFGSKLPVAPGSGNFIFNLPHVLSDGNYWWRVSAYDGIGYGFPSEAWKFSISVNGAHDRPIISVLPNPFTPNDDGYNDFVEFKYQDMDKQKPVIQLFNLKGKKVNELRDFSGSEYQWNGKDNSGRDLEPGVYIYILEVNGKRISNGTITLIR